MLDLVAKSPVKKMHLSDDDTFLQHDAFRAPGAASLDGLEARFPKVERFCGIYSNMHNAIVAHAEKLTGAKLSLP